MVDQNSIYGYKAAQDVHRSKQNQNPNDSGFFRPTAPIIVSFQIRQSKFCVSHPTELFGRKSTEKSKYQYWHS